MDIEINKKNYIIAPEDKSILELALRNRLEINHSCGGYGTCGTCRVLVNQPELLDVSNSVEQEMINDRGFKKNERLACQNKPVTGLKLSIPK